jgi:predicted GH43/DUF377 family glycosyl hydrolase
MDTLAKVALRDGGSIHPLIIPSRCTNGTGLMNPSILYWCGRLIVNLRHVNYTFYHSETKLFQHQYGPLTYIHPENDIHLRTDNYYLELDDNFNVSSFFKVDTSNFDNYEPLWDFVGLEDARLVCWDGKLYMTGVRRDTTTNGQGRMELSEIVVSKDSVKEVSRVRIEPPKHPDSYCEKNWMPVLDRPYNYVKWSNPTELVKVDPSTGSSETIFEGQPIPAPTDFRGGSQVIPYEDGYLAIIHEVDLFCSEAGRKDAVYRHRFAMWDSEFQLINYSDSFSIMGGHVEFATGMIFHEDHFLITFGFQDNAAYLLKAPCDSIISTLKK